MSMKTPLQSFLFGLLPASLPLFLTLTSSANQPTTASAVYLGDGDPVNISNWPSVPSDWMLPSAELNWTTAPAGIGNAEHFSEVSTLLNFPTNYLWLRRTFTLNSGTPDTLTLTLKHSGGPVSAFLNGELVLTKNAEELPDADELGFRSFDLSSHIDKLLSSGSNLLALQVSGDLAIPILHGTLPSTVGPFLEVDPRKARLTEGGPGAIVRVSNLTASGNSVSVYLSSRDENPLNLDDIEVFQNGLSIPIIGGPSPRFTVGIPTGTNSAEFEIRAVDDDLSEDQNFLGIRTSGAFVPEFGFPITRNGTSVTNANSSGEGSLKQAIDNANIIPGLQTVFFSDSKGIPFSENPVVISLVPGIRREHFQLSDNILIEGPASPGRVILDANGIDLFYMNRSDMTFRQLVLRNADTAINTSRYQGELVIEDCEFVGNNTALELYSLQTPTQIRRCLITESSRNAIRNSYGLPPVISNCTIAYNNGETAVSSSRSLLLDSCTIAHNQRAVSGAVIARNCLFTAHSGGIKLVNPTQFDAGGNLFEERSGAPTFPLNPLSLSGTPQSPLDPKLGELGFHGGFTRTIPILKTSPALDLGLPTSEGTPPYDQRGTGFARRTGPKPDAGAFEIQLTSSDLSLGAITSVAYDEAAGIYFQLAVIHNNSLWDLTGFQLTANGLTNDVSLYNGTGTNELDVSGGLAAGSFRIVVLQYLADRSNLLIQPQIELGILPDSDLPAPPSPSSQIMRIAFDENLPVSLNIPTKSGRNYEVEYSKDLKSWHSAGPIFWAESDHVEWHDSEPKSDAKYYRVKEMN